MKPFSIESESFYSVQNLIDLTGLSATALGRACNSQTNQLKFVVRGGQKFFRGQWVIDWLTDGEDDQTGGAPVPAVNNPVPSNGAAAVA